MQLFTLMSDLNTLTEIYIFENKGIYAFLCEILTRINYKIKKFVDFITLTYNNKYIYYT